MRDSSRPQGKKNYATSSTQYIIPFETAQNKGKDYQHQFCGSHNSNLL